MNINEFMNRYEIKTKKSVVRWLNENYIDGAIFNNNEWVIPNSARLPYTRIKNKSHLNANKLRAYIVKSSISRLHINCHILGISENEFNMMIQDLVNHNLIQIRREDGINYYDSTVKSNEIFTRNFAKFTKIITEIVTIGINVMASVLQN